MLLLDFIYIEILTIVFGRKFCTYSLFHKFETSQLFLIAIWVRVSLFFSQLLIFTVSILWHLHIIQYVLKVWRSSSYKWCRMFFNVMLMLFLPSCYCCTVSFHYYVNLTVFHFFLPLRCSFFHNWFNNKLLNACLCHHTSQQTKHLLCESPFQSDTMPNNTPLTYILRLHCSYSVPAMQCTFISA